NIYNIYDLIITYDIKNIYKCGAWCWGRVLVTGATGLLGRSLCRQLRDDGWNVTATGFRRAPPLMLRFPALTKRLFQPDVIVHCAAERRPDVVEHSSEAALNLNVHSTATLAKEAAFSSYISIQFVFVGGTRDSVILSLFLRLSDPVSSLLRLGDPPCARPVREVERVSESAVTVLWSSILDSVETCSLDHTQQRFPTSVRDVSKVCSNICSRRRQDPSIRGVFHFSGKEQMTKYEMAKSIADAFELPSDHIVPVSPAPSAPAFSAPCGPRVAASEPRPFRAAILDCLWPFTPDRRWRQTVFH
uniref:Methionine adenosyltransferase 2 subunit beta n=1 Tax=Neogobius melanostomus TaxID=47308 RepID=A0A8C6UAF9_9GOBI